MNHEIQCSAVCDLLPLYVDGLTSEKTNSLIKEHLEKCAECQKEYQFIKTNLKTTAAEVDTSMEKEVDYLKKIKKYQNINYILGAVLSFLFGASVPILKIGMTVFFEKGIPDYYLARLQVAWHIGLLKMAVCGVIGCVCYFLVMFLAKTVIKRKR